MYIMFLPFIMFFYGSLFCFTSAIPTAIPSVILSVNSTKSFTISPSKSLTIIPTLKPIQIFSVIPTLNPTVLPKFENDNKNNKRRDILLSIIIPCIGGPFFIFLFIYFYFKKNTSPKVTVVEPEESVSINVA